MKCTVSEGMHSYVISIPSLRLAFKIYKGYMLKNAVKEYKILRMLSVKGLPVPKPYFLYLGERIILAREYIEGEHFIDFIKRERPEKIAIAFKTLIEIAHMLDCENVFLDELSFPTKNIIVKSEKKMFIIDFERAVINPRRSNVTQILGFLYSSIKSGGYVGNKIKEFLDVDKMIEIAKKYRRERRLDDVLRLFKI